MPSDHAFRTIRRLIEQHGWALTRINGSHHIFTGPGRQPISVPVHKGKVKDVYRRQILKAIEDLGEQDRE